MGIYIPIADCRYRDDVDFCQIAERFKGKNYFGKERNEFVFLCQLKGYHRR
jgi:hypothetical protein